MVELLYFLAGALTALAAVFFGLRWKVEIEKEEVPTVPLPLVSEKPPPAKKSEVAQLIDEWFNGPKEEGES